MKIQEKGRNMLETSRLILRPWEDKDKAPFAALNAEDETCFDDVGQVNEEITTSAIPRTQ
ncbi:GNAT family N-acetyltransferase [Citrobacter cronae]|nr:GNAT family N-acetyltransferase [Citrobacter cronae]